MTRFYIIIPTFNRPGLLVEALGSLQKQTYKNWEAIVVNDASDQDYSEVERAFASDSRINFARRDVNGGVNQSVNTGLDIAADRYDIDFIAIMDDDDLFVPDYLEKAADVIQKHPEYGWFMSNNVGEQKNSSRSITQECELDYVDDYIYGKLRGDKGRLIAANILKDLRMDSRFRASHRWPFFTDVAQRTKIWAFPHGSIQKRYLNGGITKAEKQPGNSSDIFHRVSKHWHVIKCHPTKWVAYQYLLLESIKTPGRLIQLGFRRFSGWVSDERGSSNLEKT